LISPPQINFKPGQYIQLKIPGTEEYRAYSLASPDFIKDYLINYSACARRVMLYLCA